MSIKTTSFRAERPRWSQQGGIEDGRPIKQHLNNDGDVAATGCKWRWTQTFTTRIQRIERKHSEYNLVANNQKRKQLLIHAFVIPKGLLSLAVTVALCSVSTTNSPTFQHLQLIQRQAGDQCGFLCFLMLLMLWAQSAKRTPQAVKLAHKA